MTEDTTESGKRRKRDPSNRNHWDQNYPYDVDYNDHFETPLVAYEDIAPMLDWLAEDVPRKDQRIYDPYYCDGQTVKLFRQLGFHGIINKKRDFYKDFAANEIPDHATLVTNPPYSDQHKVKFLDIAFAQLRREEKGIPFLGLMPNYVASREYFRSCAEEDVCYIVPSKSYEYCHPEGTGKDVPPFSSLWYCGIGKDRMKKVKQYWDKLPWKQKDRKKPTLAMSLDELRAAGLVPTQKRCNPRQRKKRRQHAQNQQSAPASSPKIQRTKSQPVSRKSDSEPAGGHFNDHKTQQSKYRDGKGKRKRKRF